MTSGSDRIVFEEFPAGGSGGALPPAGQAGRVIYDDGAAWVALAAGLANQVLTSHGAAAPSWADVPFATLAASYDGVDTYLIGRPIPLRDVSGAMLRLYAHGGGSFWVATNASFNGTTWTKDYAAGPATLYSFDYLGNSAVWTQTDDPSVVTWSSWATYSETDRDGVTRNDAEIICQFGSEYWTPGGGYIGGSVNFPKKFNYTPSTFTFNASASNKLAGSLQYAWPTQYGVCWWSSVTAGAGDAYVFGTVTVSL